MPKPYILCDVQEFFKDGNNEFQTSIQESLVIDDEQVNEGQGESIIKLDQEKYYKGFDKCYCYHELKHKKYGIVRRKPFNHFFEPLKFNLYYDRDKNLILIAAKTAVALDFIKVLNDSKNFSLSAVEINYEQMEPIIPSISGAWFADLKRAHLKSAGYFGSHVNQSEEYKEAAKEGNISSLRMDYIYSPTNEEHDIGITRKGAVILYDTFSTIEDEIEIVMDIYKNLIHPEN